MMPNIVVLIFTFILLERHFENNKFGGFGNLGTKTYNSTTVRQFQESMRITFKMVTEVWKVLFRNRKMPFILSSCLQNVLFALLTFLGISSIQAFQHFILRSFQNSQIKQTIFSEKGILFHKLYYIHVYVIIVTGTVHGGIFQYIYIIPTPILSTNDIHTYNQSA